MLHKALLREGIDARNLSALDRLSLVGNGGMGALTYEPHTHVQMEEEKCDFDVLQTKALDNKDDHCKNFSYIMKKDNYGKWCWHLAPAYDLTLCTEGYNGQHATSVNGSGKPTMKDFIAVGTQIKITEKKCREIIQQVYDNCGDLLRYRFHE